MTKTKKPPPNTPSPGDRVKLRGRDYLGTLTRTDPSNWSWVDWDVYGQAPRICHLYELETATPSHPPES